MCGTIIPAPIEASQKIETMSHDKRQQALFNAIAKLLRPLVRVLLRNGIPVAAFTDVAKHVYVDVAAQEFNVAGRKQTNSRVATITGLSRKEVKRIKEIEGIGDPIDIVERYHRAARVVSGWVHAKRFIDEKGRPLPLPFDGVKISFATLVKDFSGDVPPRAVLDELLQAGIVERKTDGRLRLLQRAYIPKAGEIEKLGILGTDVAGLIATIDHNIQSAGDDPYFQRKVYYDNLSEEAVAELRLLIELRGQELLEEMNQWMAQRDRDANPNAVGTGRKAAGVGVYYFVDEPPEDEGKI